MKLLYALNLHLFEGEGAAAAAGEAGAQGEAVKANLPGSTRRGKSGALSNVLYGSEADAMQTAPAAEEQKPEVKITSNTLEEKRKAFRDMISGEYKDQYSEEVQRVIDRRFAETKNLQKQVDDAKPILDKLAARYNVLDGDMSKLAQAIDNDRTYWAAAAEEAGMDERAYREMQDLKRQNAELLRMQQDQMARAQADAQVQRWFEESQAVKARFPQFDFNTELQNPKFVELLQHHMPVEDAYKILHFDELMSDNAVNTQKAVTENIRAKGARPAENGTASQSTFTVKRSASQLNRADRMEIAARVRRGEKISF